MYMYRATVTTVKSSRKLLEIQSKPRLKQDALMEGQVIYERELTNEKVADVTPVVMRN